MIKKLSSDEKLDQHKFRCKIFKNYSIVYPDYVDWNIRYIQQTSEGLPHLHWTTFSENGYATILMVFDDNKNLDDFIKYYKLEKHSYINIVKT